MDDSLSVKSSDSTTTSDEYEFIPLSTNVTKVPLNNINEQPLLKIAGNGDLDQLQKYLGEMLNEDISFLNSKVEPNNHSNFHDKVLSVESTLPNEEQLEPLADISQKCTLFGCISYLGSAAINAPKSKTEIIRNMTILNEQSSDHAIKVSLSIPNTTDGVVLLYDASSTSVMARYNMQRITFYQYGLTESNEKSCFAFTYWHGESQETSLFQCHVFRCDIPEAVVPVSLCFSKALQKLSNTMNSTVTAMKQANGDTVNCKSIQKFEFEVGLEVKEDDGKGNFSPVPRDRNAFKLRTNVMKQIHITVQQIPSKDQPELEIKRCFGFLISPRWNVKNSDMQLLDMLSVSNDDDEYQKLFVVAGKWDPKESVFEGLNTEATQSRLTVAIDLVIEQIKEPVRLPVKIQCKMYSQNERFWSFSKGHFTHRYSLYLKEVSCCNESFEPIFEVISIEPEVVDKSLLNLNHTWSSFASLIRSTSATSIEALSPIDDYSDSDEPMVSGTGEVSKDCPDRELELWNDLLAKWTDTSSRPKQLTTLVKQGIPEALRGEVWQRLTINEKDEELLNNYRLLISKECSAELIIKKDIHRTFPAHDYFKEVGGVGQDTLFNISKAYAAYDTEVGYCQGLTFIAASLLLHMPEEQAFCVLVRLMYDYKLRNLYKDGFEILNMKQYQLNRLLEEKDPELWQHFKNLGVETHMFAHHWFLTLYTARFPLYFVFFILDVVLVQGLDTIFQIALSLLITFRKDLLELDFENIVKYIQVNLPKRCRHLSTARKVIKRATSIKLKKLKKYEREFIEMKIARENVEQYNNELEKLKKILVKVEDEKRLILNELTQTKEAVQKFEVENERNANIITSYKQICQRLDEEQTATRAILSALQNKISRCDHCSSLLHELSVHANGIHAVNMMNNNKEEDDVDLTTKVKELELELAQTKLALVEAECRNQDLTHQLSSISAELQTVRNQYPPWLHKTLSSIKEVTANKRAVNTQNVTNRLFNMSKTETILN